MRPGRWTSTCRSCASRRTIGRCALSYWMWPASCAPCSASRCFDERQGVARAAQDSARVAGDDDGVGAAGRREPAGHGLRREDRAVDRHRRRGGVPAPLPQAGGDRVDGRSALPPPHPGGDDRGAARAGERGVPHLDGSGRAHRERGPAHRRAAACLLGVLDLRGAGRARPARRGRAPGAGKRRGPQPGGPVPHAHLIVDNEPALEIDDASQPFLLVGLARGPHLLRAVLCRPWHEVVKARHAFAMARFWIGPTLPGKAGKAAEYVAWPDPHKPILTYVLPLGDPPKALKLDREAPEQDPTEAKALDPPPDAAPRHDRPALDFYLANGRLGRRRDKLPIVLNPRDLPLIVHWTP